MKFALLFIGIGFILGILFIAGPGGKTRLETLLKYPHPLPQINFSTLELQEKPNQFLVCSDDLCKNETPHLTAPAFEIEARRLRQIFRTMALEQTDTTLVHQDDHILQDDYVARTKWMRYPDIVTVKFVELGGGRSTFALYSRSVYGHSDFGVNEKRVTDWLSKLDDALPKT